MQFNIPQFIDKEDKIVGPFTAKQLGWMFGGGATLLVLWNLLDFTAFILAAIFVVGIFGTLAFWRPYSQSCISFLLSVFHFSAKPKFYIWKRLPIKSNIGAKKTTKKTNKEERLTKKQLSEKKIVEISKILDSY